MATEKRRETSTSLLRLVEDLSQQAVQRCYQCDKCATGCPMLEQMDFSTNQLFRLMEIGAEDEVLGANTAWLCASCYTCSVRCPNQIDIAQVMDVVRTIAYERGYASPLERFTGFHELFLDIIRRRGRINEVSLMARFNTNPLDLLSQSKLGWTMFRKGRLKWPSPGVKDRKSLKRIFESAADNKEDSHGL